MIDNRGVVTCDCCARQIVSYYANDKYTVGPREGTLSLGFGKHACRICAPDEIAWQEMMEGGKP